MIEISIRIVVVGIVFLSFLSLYRVVFGPRAADRIVGTNVILTNVILAILILSYMFNNYTYIDVAYVYVLSAFVGTICVMKSLGKRKLS